MAFLLQLAAPAIAARCEVLETTFQVWQSILYVIEQWGVATDWTISQAKVASAYV